MLEKFLKKATGQDEALAATQVEQMAQMSEMLETANGMIAQLESDVAEKVASLQDALAKIAEFEAVANEAKAVAEAAAKEAAEMKMEQRKVQLADVIGAENPSFGAIFGAIQQIDDAAFDVIVGGYKQQFEAEAKSPMFNEVGYSVAEAEAPHIVGAISKEAEILKQKYQSK